MGPDNAYEGLSRKSPTVVTARRTVCVTPLQATQSLTDIRLRHRGTKQPQVSVAVFQQNPVYGIWPLGSSLLLGSPRLFVQFLLPRLRSPHLRQVHFSV